MAYVPSSVYVYMQSFAGAVAGMTTAFCNQTNGVKATYSLIASIAATFAQEFDTQWAANPGGNPTTLDVDLIQTLTANYWLQKPQSDDASALLTSTYSAECLAMIASILASRDNFAAQGINPPAYPPGGGAASSDRLVTPTTNIILAQAADNQAAPAQQRVLALLTQTALVAGAPGNPLDANAGDVIGFIEPAAVNPTTAPTQSSGVTFYVDSVTGRYHMLDSEGVLIALTAGSTSVNNGFSGTIP